MKKSTHPTHEIATVFRTSLGSIGTDILTKAANVALLNEKVGNARITITIVSDEEIHQLNNTWLNHDYPTDIITFPLETEPLEAELVISADTARRQSREYRVSMRSELARLVIHGILHLTGFDDTNEPSRIRMKEREDDLVTRFMQAHRKKH